MSGHESWFEKIIREASDAGEFDHLPGAGKPLPDLDRRYDPDWWARRWIERESVAESAREVAAAVRREVPGILAGADESAMAVALHGLNERIDQVNQRLDPADRLPMLEVDGMIASRASRPGS